ncbi:MerR family transcriptional regulator [Microlunatus flavus]|uniref:DNA-binding transcriptional regulator, MerR family n=1 Tax=Microlunatus flavus TaxID=1036181 RepID=A0A1H9AEU7_9ACTN|nr:MerR family transcriptional regulator [Microlunatus flavus]SEP75210.1 DNA-binding transcriptional regulator, MerR family [Microlunatus flavus]
MRISELSRRADVPVATVKYYLREGLLHAGELTSATQARYDESHVTRLRLVRSLLGPGALSVARARAVLRAIDDPPASPYELLGVAAEAVRRPVEVRPHPEVHALVERWGWSVDEDACAEHQALADALEGLRAAGFESPPGVLDAYAAAMDSVAEAELARVPFDSLAAAVRYVVLGVVLNEPVLLAMRRLAEQAAAWRQVQATR